MFKLLFFASLIFSFSASHSSANVSALKCLFAALGPGKLTVLPARYSKQTTKDTFHVTDKNNPWASFKASLTGDGDLVFTVILTNPEEGVRSSLSGQKLYDEMMTHFGVDNIKNIQGLWLEGTNLEEFEAALAEGLNREDAAMQTWSGRMAEKYGFSRAKDIEYIPDDGSGLSYARLNFVRP